MLIKDPALLPELAAQKKEENELFRYQLKQMKGAELDPLISKIENEITAAIDCTSCANCCKKLEAGISEEEIQHLATIKNCTVPQFVDTYTQKEFPSGIQFIRHTPCSFLENNRCTVYSCRPAACVKFPSLSGPDFKYRLRTVFNNYKICPIVYNSIEQMKKILSKSTLLTPVQS